LLGNGDAVFFHFAIRVIGPGAHPQAACVPQQHEFSLAAGGFTDGLDHGVRRNARYGGAIEDRCICRRLDAQGLKLPNMLFDRSRIAAGPAGDDELIDCNRCRI
jgi:hypothetical protein